MNNPSLVIERSEHLFRIQINRPEKKNAINLDLVKQLHQACDEARQQPCILVIESTTPGVFVAGADVGELASRTGQDALARINGAVFDKLAEHPWPSIAMVDGAALGGGSELALACDFRLGTDRARFAQPEAQLGIIAGAGANWRLKQIVGLQIARQVLLAGRVLSSEEAQAHGLLDEVFSVDELESGLQTWVSRLVKNSWQALEFTKKALRLETEAATFAFDAAAQAVLFESDEKHQRMNTFLSRKKS